MIVVDDLALLARGGTAALFTARASGRRVVVKVPERDGALAHEARVLASIGSAAAPRVIGMTRIDEREGLVLEYLAMPTLRALRSAEGEIVEIAAAICNAVATVHAAGFVHGDVTPDNVLVDGREVRLVDFGCAAPIGALLPALATTGYAAPERMVAVCVATPAVDVYALGVICFELLAGAHPFGGVRGERRVAHATRRSPRLSNVAPEIGAIVTRALEKSAAERPTASELACVLRTATRTALTRTHRSQRASVEHRRRAIVVSFSSSPNGIDLSSHARDLGAVEVATRGERRALALWSNDPDRRVARLVDRLRALGARDIDAGAATIELDISGRPSVVSMTEREPADSSRVAFVGRDSVVRDALDAIERCRLVTIIGAAGHGKSRLASRIAAELHDPIMLRAPDVAAAVAALGSGTDDVVEEAALAVLAGHRALAGSAAHHLAPAPGALRHAAARALARRFTGTIVIDDAHAADPVVLDAAELATASTDGDLCVVVLARPALATTRPRWGRRTTHTRIDVAPLDRDDGRRLVRALLPAEAVVPLAAIDRIVSRCGGVPLYICELVTALRREAGKPTRGALATDLVDLPREEAIVAWAVDDQLAALSRATRAAVEALAVAGGVLATSDAVRILDAIDIELDSNVAIADAISSGLLVARPSQIAFRHDLVRDAVMQGIPPARRQALHLALLDLATCDEERARHAEGAGLESEAARAWLSVADAARAHHADLAEENALTRALACGLERADIVRRRAAARARLGRYDAAGNDFARARTLASGDRIATIEVLLDESLALDWSLHHAQSAACARAAAALVLPRDSPALLARAEMASGRSAWRGGDSASAIESCRRALAIAAPLGDVAYETTIGCRLMLGFILGSRGDIDEASHLLDDALASAADRGDLVHAAAARCNRFVVHAARGTVTELRADLVAFAAAGRELGVAVTEYRGELYQALVAAWIGDDAFAFEHAHAARRLEAADPELMPRPRAAVLLAELAARTGDRTAARAWYETARARASAPVDAATLDGIASWLDGELDRARAHRHAARLVDLGEPEAAHQILELCARTMTEPALRAVLRAEARAVPALPAFMRSPR